MMNHVLYGATIPFLIGMLLYVMRRGRASLVMLILIPLAMTSLALWASAPDIPRMLGFHDFYQRIHFDPRINIFLWHFTIDQNETDSSWYTVGVALEAAGVMTMAIRTLFQEEKR